MAVNPEVIIVCDYEEGYEILVEEFDQLIPNWPKSSRKIRCVDREDFFHLLQELDKRGNVPRFVFALPRQSRIIIYHKEDPVNSYYDEINDAMAYIDEIEKLLILVYNFDEPIKDKEIHHPDIKRLWKNDVQPGLKQFESRILTTEEFAFNPSQEKLLKQFFSHLAHRQSATAL